MCVCGCSGVGGGACRTAPACGERQRGAVTVCTQQRSRSNNNNIMPRHTMHACDDWRLVLDFIFAGKASLGGGARVSERYRTLGACLGGNTHTFAMPAISSLQSPNRRMLLWRCPSASFVILGASMYGSYIESHARTHARTATGGDRRKKKGNRTVFRVHDARQLSQLCPRNVPNQPPPTQSKQHPGFSFPCITTFSTAAQRLSYVTESRGVVSTAAHGTGPAAAAIVP